MAQQSEISLQVRCDIHGTPIEYIVELEKDWPFVVLYRTEDERDAKLFLAQCLIYRDMIHGIVHASS